LKHSGVMLAPTLYCDPAAYLAAPCSEELANDVWDVCGCFCAFVVVVVVVFVPTVVVVVFVLTLLSRS
jgi:hypothetical protein